jgi:chaperonin GroES
MTAIAPLDDIVFVVPEEATTQSGIILANHQQCIGRVEYAGPGKRLTGDDGREYHKPMNLKAGDRVLFSHHAGMEKRVEGRDFLVMREADVMCVLADDADVSPTENRKGWGM